MKQPIFHDPCGARWGTYSLPDILRHQERQTVVHVCIDGPNHPMEHRCRCGELYPS